MLHQVVILMKHYRYSIECFITISKYTNTGPNCELWGTPSWYARSIFISKTMYQRRLLYQIFFLRLIRVLDQIGNEIVRTPKRFCRFLYSSLHCNQLIYKFWTILRILSNTTLIYWFISCYIFFPGLIQYWTKLWTLRNTM